jgi:hypothetical protein
MLFRSIATTLLALAYIPALFAGSILTSSNIAGIQQKIEAEQAVRSKIASRKDPFALTSGIFTARYTAGSLESKTPDKLTVVSADKKTRRSLSGVFMSSAKI